MGNEMGAVIGAAIAMMVVYLLSFGLMLANYIMTSWGIYSIADRRQISNPWLAWLPIGNFWITGSIVDEYDGRNGIKRKWRMTLLILELVVIVALILCFVVFFAGIFAIAFQSDFIETDLNDVLGVFIPIYITAILMALVASALQILNTICLYKIFESTVPEKSVKYILLSILVPLASAICLMICRNKGYSNPRQKKIPVVVQNQDALEAPIDDEPKVEEIQSDVIDKTSDGE